jgi:hypothetical protein
MYDREMDTIFLSAVIAVAAILLMQVMRHHRDLAKRAADARLEAMRLGRHVERLEMVLKQSDPELFAHVKARSDLEWQQAVKSLAQGDLPTLYPLEKTFTPIQSTSNAG